MAFVCLIYRFVEVEEVNWVITSAAFLLMTCNALLETFTYQVDNLILSLLLAPAVLNINWLNTLVSKMVDP